MPLKFEQNRMVRTTRNFELFDKQKTKQNNTNKKKKKQTKTNKKNRLFYNYF